jgi:hypothetical protein
MSKTRIDPGPFVVPMPLVLVGAMADGRANFMPAAFVGIVNFKPPIVACGLNPTHHTARGIEQTQTFSLNLPSPEQVVATDYCGLASGTKVDKSRVFGSRGQAGGAPMIRDAGSPPSAGWSRLSPWRATRSTSARWCTCGGRRGRARRQARLEQGLTRCSSPS